MLLLSLALPSLAALLAPASSSAVDGWTIYNGDTYLLSSGTVTGGAPGDRPNMLQVGGSLIASGAFQVGYHNNVPSPVFFQPVNVKYQIDGGQFQSNGLNIGDASITNIYAGSGLFTQTGGTVNIGGSGIQIQTPTSSYAMNGGTLTTTSISFGYGTPSSEFHGDFRLNGGVVATSSINLVHGSSNFVFNGGTLRATGDGTWFNNGLGVYMEVGGATIDTAGFNRTLGASILDAKNADAGLTKIGEGTLTLTRTNLYHGPTTVSAGTLQFASLTALPNDSPLIVASGATGAFNVGGANEFTWSGISGRLGGFAAGSSLGLDTTNAVGGYTISDVISGNIALTKLGGGTLTLAGSNTYTGNTIVNGGLVEFSNVSAFGNAANKISLNGGGLRWATGNTTDISGRLNAIGAGGAIFDTNGNFVTLASAISGAGALIKSGAGTLRLTAANTYMGDTIVNGGFVEFSNVSAFGNAANKISLNGGGLRWATGNTTDISGRLNALGAGGATFDTNGNFVTLASAISGAGPLIKNGAGTLRLSAANTYTGGTVINSGSLTVGANNALGTGIVRVQGGTLDVQDAVAFTNNVVLSAGSYSRTVTGSLVGKVNATSDLAGGTDTTARILAGSLGSTSTLITSFSSTSAALNDSARESDVYSFVGTGTNTFVLELSSVSLGEDAMVGWLSNGEWVLAINGNTGNTATVDMQGFDGSYTEFLAAYGGIPLSLSIGAYGYDEETHSAWAVLNHNSDFAVIPEPGTVAMLVLGGVALLARRRRG